MFQYSYSAKLPGVFSYLLIELSILTLINVMSPSSDVYWNRRAIRIRIGCLLGSRDHLQLNKVEIRKFTEIICMDVVIGTVTELRVLWYSIHSALSSIRSISSLAEHELQHRGRIYDNRAIQASLYVKLAVKNVFWPS